MKKVTKAVFPVAGLGTRFLPATKASPKEMMPIVDKPLIQYAVEEAVAAGVTDMIFVTGRSKRAIEDHFDKAYELENELAARGKNEMLDFVRGMLPRNRLGRQMLDKLKVYPGLEHPHQGQAPQALDMAAWPRVQAQE